MANFKAWVETDKRTGNFIVRHYDGTRTSSGRLKQFTDYNVEKTQKMILNGEEKTGKWLANALKDKVMQKYFLQATGNFDMTLEIAPLVQQWIQNGKSRRLSWFTTDHYGFSLDRFRKDMDINIIGGITTDRIKEWRSLMFNRGDAWWSIRGRLSDLRIFLGWLKEEKKIGESPFTLGIMPEEKEATPRFFNDLQFNALDEASTQLNPALRIAIHLAHGQGLRKIEMVGDGRDRMGVLWEDIIWKEDKEDPPELLVRKEVAKGQKKARKIPLDPFILELLGSRKTGPLVVLERWRLDHLFNKAKKLAKLDPKIKLTPHGLRHTFAKDMLQRGGFSMGAVQDLLGHSDPKTTRIYAQYERSHMTEGVMKAYRQRLKDQALLGKSPIKIIVQENNAGQIQGKVDKKIGSDDTRMNGVAL